MAGLCGLKTLLLWAGIIGLANCQIATSNQAYVSTLPPRTTTNSTDTPTTAHILPLTLSTTSLNPSMPTPYSTGITATTAPSASTLPSPIKTAQTLTQPQNTTSTTTVTPDTKATTQAPPPPPQCPYTVKPIPFGFRIEMTSTTGNYTISLKEKGSETGNNFTVQFSNKTHDIEHLKPCTEYEHNVTLIEGPDNETPCDCTEETTKTTGMSKDDITDGSNMPGYVCYRSGWNISSSLAASNNMSAKPNERDNKEFCIKLGFNDTCTDLTTTFTSGNKCVDSFNLTRSITVGFLNPSEIKQTISTDFPVKIQPKISPNCKNLSIDYTCRDGKLSETRTLSELEPYTSYSCAGRITDNNVTIKTTAIKINIDCDLKIDIIKKQINSTNTTIALSWDTDINKCKDVLDLPKLSYICSCVPTSSKQKQNTIKNSSGGTCIIDGLKPNTYYTCKVQPQYNKKDVAGLTDAEQHKTQVGKPQHIDHVTVTQPEHNAVKVTCTYTKEFFGHEKKFIARLDNGGSLIERTEDKCEFDFKDLSYSTKYTLKVIAYNGKKESDPHVTTFTTFYNDKAVIGFLVFLILLTSVALLLVVYKIYILKRRESHDLGENMMLISTASDEENLLAVEPIAAEVLLETYKRKLADEGRLFLAEFQSMPRIFSRYAVKEAKKACNGPKNRYVDILPYDYNRVQLTTGNGETGCDYTNASFIDGYKESKKYIAAQGPKEETVCDFWRMVWEQQSSIIVMVTRCEEGNRVKCAQYWPSPDREAEIFEEFIVKLNSEDYCPDYTIRHLSLTNKREKNSEREVTHIQFMSWPDHGVPGEPHLLLKLRRRVNAFKNFFSGPIVVHCSAGVGRTGTYIGIDAMMEGLEAEGKVDIYGYVVRLRRQRCLMVQVEAQYILIHQALLEHNQFGETETTVSELHSSLFTLKQNNSGNEPTLLEEEFERLPIYKNWRTFNTGLTEENKKKNRSPSVIPYDYNRVLLKLNEERSHDSDHDAEDEEESSDEEDEESTLYINASHIDGYWGPQTFIAAQSPLPDTVADFWFMVYQKKASTIVMLSDCSEGQMESDCVYWDNDNKTFGDFEVEVASTDTSPTFISRNLLIRHVKRKERRPVKQFQFLKWASNGLPEKPQDLTDMIKDIKHSCGRGKSQRSMSIVVHCNDGSSRTGIFCALWNLLDSAETEKLVDVFQVAKTLRKERQGMLSKLEHYQLLYDALGGVFPVQNGEVKAVQASAADSIQVVNETTAAEQPAEDKAVGTTNSNQQGAAEIPPLVADGAEEEKKEEPEKVSSAPIETTPLGDTINEATVTVEV
ncbi:receptor-type tyrosine-protein phosphatase C isoform X2 [Cottoperca gobio]|uniref:Receptor-type tyrosine-protein phosphatase C n=1 Tax=Cottoperca gobio TaxID=56716 RepID=A0A6J2PJU1_COTGO|nr:receptor-type tyrosine-protein phosphatase C isoform X2 [Cottoperca gobio]